MKSKSKCTTYDRALQEVEGFSQVYTVMRQQTAIGGRTDSTFYNYIHRIALVSLHFVSALTHYNSGFGFVLPEVSKNTQAKTVKVCFGSIK